MEMGRLRADLERLKQEEFFIIDQTTTTSSTLKIYKQRLRSDIRKYWFPNRVVHECKNRPREAVIANSVNRFKNRIDPMIRKVGGIYEPA